MNKRAIILVGLGFGDEGKGAWTDRLARTLKADLVVRYSGGSQCGHNVEWNGYRHTFSQFGAGTLAGVPTYLGPQVIINPQALVREGMALRAVGLKPNLRIHPQCLVSTIYHQRLNQLRELTRNLRHGSCGHGIGETRRYWLNYGADAIIAQDLWDQSLLHHKLELCRQRLLIEAERLIHSDFDVSKSFELAKYSLLPILARAEAQTLATIGHEWIKLATQLPPYTLAIFEGAQGVLLDEWHGFHPHTTWSTVTPHYALELAAASGASQITTLGVTRTYLTRHGQGPLPSYDKALTDQLLDPGNPYNQWQGSLSCGWLDLPLLRYAIAACGPLNGVLISHLDQKVQFVCDSYALEGVPFKLATPTVQSLIKQEALGKILAEVLPVLQPVPNAGIEAVLQNTLEAIPIVGRAYGPSSHDRKLLPL